jgi:hypothetical protein
VPTEDGLARMKELSIGSMKVAVDAALTTQGHASGKSPDPLCCNACATFLLVVARGFIPPEVMSFFAAAGIDPSRPIEAWGAPDGGFLQVWWPFVGAAHETIPAAMTTFGSGLTCRFTDNFPRPRWPVEPARILAVELTWQDQAITELEQETRPVGT